MRKTIFFTCCLPVFFCFPPSEKQIKAKLQELRTRYRQEGMYHEEFDAEKAKILNNQ